MSKKPQRVGGEAQTSIPHFRAYKSGLTRSGEQFYLFYSVQVQASPDRPPWKVLMSTGEVITDNEIRGWVDSARLPFPLNNEDLAVLAEALNLMRVTIHAKDAAPFHLESAMQRVIKNIDGLLRDLPKVIKFGRESGSQGAVPAINALENLLSVTGSADESLAIRAGKWGKRQGPKRRSAPWHYDMQYLAWILERAATRSGKPVSFTQPAAPAVKFIDAALERAHIVHGGPEIMAREMARYNAKNKKDMARYNLKKASNSNELDRLK